MAKVVPISRDVQPVAWSACTVATRILRELEPSIVIFVSVIQIIVVSEQALAGDYGTFVVGDHYSEVVRKECSAHST